MILQTGEHWIGVFGASANGLHNIKDILSHLTQLSSPYESDIQLFNAEFIATGEHLHFATIQAEEAIKSKNTLANSLAMEIFLHASAQRQIEKALETVGVHEGSTKIVILIVGRNRESILALHPKVLKILDALEKPDLLSLTSKKIEKLKEYFKISPHEFQGAKKATPYLTDNQVLVDLIIDRCSRLTLEKKSRG